MQLVPLQAHFSLQRRLWNLHVPTQNDPAIPLSFTPEQFRAFVRQLHHLQFSTGERRVVWRILFSDGEQDIALDIDTSTMHGIANYLNNYQESYECWVGQAL
jgi:hypothetical protein